ncbi:hypothetical protein BSNK01_14770 [Bacillaceae bacterium]
MDKQPEQKMKGWELPRYYGENRIHLMVVSPTSLYAYWEVTWPRMRMTAEYLQADYAALPKGLRLYDVSDIYFNGHNAHWYQDIFVHHEADDWWIDPIQPGREYIVDYGVHHNGRFLPLLRSPVASVPHAAKGGAKRKCSVCAGGTERPNWCENFSTYSIYDT